MLSQRCESPKYHQIYNETSVVLRRNNYFFLTRYLAGTNRLTYKKSNLFNYIFVTNCQFFQAMVFPSSSVGICPINMNIGMLYHMSNKCFIKNIKQDEKENMKRFSLNYQKNSPISLKCLLDNLYRQ